MATYRQQAWLFRLPGHPALACTFLSQMMPLPGLAPLLAQHVKVPPFKKPICRQATLLSRAPQASSHTCG